MSGPAMVLLLNSNVTVSCSSGGAPEDGALHARLLPALIYAIFGLYPKIGILLFPPANVAAISDTINAVVFPFNEELAY